MKRLVYTLLMVALTVVTNAQNADWQPVSTWPFTFEQFQKAVIYTSPANMIVKANANVHVAGSTLWYESNGKKLEAKQGTVNKVVFPDSTVYYNVFNKLCRVLSEDTINGKVCRLYMAEIVDKPLYEEMVRTNRQSTMMMLDFAPGLADLASSVADNEGVRNVEQEPLPMCNKFYMLYNDEIFEVTESNILKHLATKQERNTYRGFTRSAEILYGSKQSILNVWKTFFVK